MMIALIDEGNANRRACEFLSSSQPAEAGPDDDHVVLQIHSSLPDSLRTGLQGSLAQISERNPTLSTWQIPIPFILPAPQTRLAGARRTRYRHVRISNDYR